MAECAVAAVLAAAGREGAGEGMREFVDKLNDERIVQAIAAAEGKTSAEIRVFITRVPQVDAVAAARREFVRLGMVKTKERNGVLILVAPESRNFGIVGDEGIHAKCGEEFWKEVAREMEGHFRADAPTDGIVHGVRKAGEVLARHFPRTADDRNELSDQVSRD